MRNFNKLDINSLKAFYYSAETKNFSKAATLSGFTQSGISQHVSKLEEELEVKLFRRGQRGVEITEAGILLKKFADGYLDSIDHLMQELDYKLSDLSGIVRYGMPSSCLKTPHFPLLLQARKDFPKIDLSVSIIDNESILEGILASELDFGFVTKKVHNTGLEFKKFATEEYLLVGTKKLIQSFGVESLFSTPFINYPGMGALLEYWQKSNFTSKRSFNSASVNIVGEINDLDGAINMCLHGMGVSVFPSHCVEDYISRKKLISFDGKKNPNEIIYIVHRRNPAFPARIEKILETFWEMK